MQHSGEEQQRKHQKVDGRADRVHHKHDQRVKHRYGYRVAHRRQQGQQQRHDGDHEVYHVGYGRFGVTDRYVKAVHRHNHQDEKRNRVSDFTDRVPLKRALQRLEQHAENRENDDGDEQLAVIQQFMKKK